MKSRTLLINPQMHQSVDAGYLSVQIPINLGYIASALEEINEEVKIIDFCVDNLNTEEFIEEIKKFNPRIIGFTSFTSSIPEVDRLSRIIKENTRITTILGGVHASAIPRETLEELKHIDLLIIGEGELTIKEFYKNMDNIENIKGMAYRKEDKIIINKRRNLIEDINTIKFPARHLFDIEKYKKSHVSKGFSRKQLRIVELVTSRGCPNMCIFCAGHINYGNKLRFRNFENIKEEIDWLIKKFDVNHISIEDDTFTLNKELVYRLGGYLKEKNITWNCNSRVTTVDGDLLKSMKKNNCLKISFGVESGSPKVIKLIKKGITVELAKNAFYLAKKSKIRYVEGTFIIGNHPEETLEDIEMTKKLIFELMPDFVSVSILTPFPGTEIYSILKEQGMLRDKLDWSKFTFINNIPPYERMGDIKAQELIEIQTNILKEYYSKPKYIFQQIKKIRNIRELNYFMKLGLLFIKKFKN